MRCRLGSLHPYWSRLLGLWARDWHEDIGHAGDLLSLREHWRPAHLRMHRSHTVIVGIRVLW